MARSTNITIEPIYITTINLAGNDIITVGNQTTLSATITPNDATNKNLNWSSSNEEVATVNNNGLVTALNSGTVTITATATDGSGVSAAFIIITGKAPTINNTEFYISINTTVDTIIGNLNIKNNPESLRILEHPDGDHNYFSIDNDNNLVLTNELTTTKTSIIELTAANQFGTTTEDITINITTINQIAKLLAFDGISIQYGYAVATDGQYIVVTDGLNNLFIYKINNDNTISELQKISGTGLAVAIHNNYIVVGNFLANNSKGKATLFTINPQTDEITQTAVIEAADGSDGDRFGTSVALNNNTILIGAPGSTVGNSDINGYAYLFNINTQTNTVSQTAKLLAADGRSDDKFGRSVALNNNYALIGAYFHDHSKLTDNGAAYLFDLTNITPNTTSTHTTKLVATDGGGGDRFGFSVALNNNYALIGASSHGHSSLFESGAAYLFDLTNITPNTTSTHTTKLVANDGGGGDNFGTAVALNNNYALIGANLHNHSGLTDNGAAYLFDITGIVPNTTITHTTKLVANDGGGGDNFGFSVALNDDYALIGAYYHDHSGLTDNGAAYVFDL